MVSGAASGRFRLFSRFRRGKNTTIAIIRIFADSLAFPVSTVRPAALRVRDAACRLCLFSGRFRSITVRSTVAEVRRSALLHNLHEIRRTAPDAQVMAMVKANAYGHGMIEVAHVIEPAVDFFGVAVMSEGLALRSYGITKPIVVMMPPDIYDAQHFCERDLQLVACSMDILRDFDAEARRFNKVMKAHLYIDTGMRRDGIEPHDARAFMDECSTLKNIKVIGICTHFASSDDADTSFTEHQLTLFNDTMADLARAGYTFDYVHASNSGALFRHPRAHFNLVRVGLSLYGIAPASVVDSPLQPVLTLKTRVNALRRIAAGESVSYGRRFVSAKETTIATIPIGYGDGYSRMLTGKAQCLLHGKRFPIVGAICMDECMIDAGDEEVKLGDEVVLIGPQGAETISAREIAETLHTIPYEITSMITSRVPRVVVD
jgi:alanine racemase